MVGLLPYARQSGRLYLSSFFPDLGTSGEHSRSVGISSSAGSLRTASGNDGEGRSVAHRGSDSGGWDRFPHRPVRLSGNYAASGAGGRSDHGDHQKAAGNYFPHHPPPSGKELRHDQGPPGKAGQRGSIRPGSLFLQDFLAVFYRILSGGCDGDHLLLRDCGGGGGGGGENG